LTEPLTPALAIQLAGTPTWNPGAQLGGIGPGVPYNGTLPDPTSLCFGKKPPTTNVSLGNLYGVTPLMSVGMAS